MGVRSMGGGAQRSRSPSCATCILSRNSVLGSGFGVSVLEFRFLDFGFEYFGFGDFGGSVLGVLVFRFRFWSFIGLLR